MVNANVGQVCVYDSSSKRREKSEFKNWGERICGKLVHHSCYQLIQKVWLVLHKPSSLETHTSLHIHCVL